MSTRIQWQKSSFSGGGGENCVEVAHLNDGIAIRESDDPDLILTTNPEQFRTFLIGVKSGEWDHFAS